MDLQARKYQFIRELIKVEKASIMDKLESILKKELPARRETIDEYNKEIDEAIEQIENGEYYTDDEIKKISEHFAT